MTSDYVPGELRQFRFFTVLDTDFGNRADNEVKAERAEAYAAGYTALGAGT